VRPAVGSSKSKFIRLLLLSPGEENRFVSAHAPQLRVKCKVCVKGSILHALALPATSHLCCSENPRLLSGGEDPSHVAYRRVEEVPTGYPHEVSNSITYRQAKLQSEFDLSFHSNFAADPSLLSLGQAQLTAEVTILDANTSIFNDTKAQLRFETAVASAISSSGNVSVRLWKMFESLSVSPDDHQTEISASALV
jgi:hypothetical protein